MGEKLNAVPSSTPRCRKHCMRDQYFQIPSKRVIGHGYSAIARELEITER